MCFSALVVSLFAHDDNDDDSVPLLSSLLVIPLEPSRVPLLSSLLVVPFEP